MRIMVLSKWAKQVKWGGIIEETNKIICCILWLGYMSHHYCVGYLVEFILHSLLSKIHLM